MRKILITGGLGFLGQHLVHSIRQGYPDAAITILARSHKIFFLEDFSKDANIKIVYDTDLNDPSTLEPHLSGIEIVFHTAAMISFWRKDRKALYRTNIGGTQNLIDLCLQYGIKRLIYVSSTAAMGYNNNKDIPTDETYKFKWKKAYIYAYMMSKYLAEERVKATIQKGLPAIIANPSTICGPGDTKIFPLLDNLKAGKVPAILPGGFAIIDVRDAASALVTLIEKGRIGENYLFTGGNYTYVQVLTTLANAAGASPPPKTMSMSIGPLLVPIISLMETLSPKQPKLTNEIFAMGFKFRYYSTKKAEKELGWEPKITFEQTFHDTVEYYNKRS
jgi:dihydroflavonol-4-reductase